MRGKGEVEGETSRDPHGHGHEGVPFVRGSPMGPGGPTLHRASMGLGALLAFGLLATAGPAAEDPRIGADRTSPSVGATGTDSVPFDSIFRLEDLAPGAWAAVVRPDAGAYAFANSLVVAGDDGVLVVDTQQSPAAADALATRIADLTDVPVRWVVNTHWHGDHVYGNQVYRSRWPGVRIVGHTTLPSDLGEIGARKLKELRERVPRLVDDRRRMLDRGTGPDGSPLGTDERRRLRRSLELNEAYLQRLMRLELVPPTVTFERHLGLDLGGRRVVVHHFGPAHTRGDVVVHLPDEAIVAAGDLVEEGLPYVDDADPEGWSAALDSVLSLDPAVLLPAHGSVVRDRRLVEAQRDLFDAIAAHADEPGRASSVLSNLQQRGWSGWSEMRLDPRADRERLLGWLESALRRARRGR